MRLRGRRRPKESEPLTVEQLREYAVRETARPGGRDVAAGQLEGLSAEITSRARLVPAEGESQTHHTGYLLGRFLVWVESTGRALDEELALIASTYFASLSGSGAEGRWEPKDPQVRAHTYGMVAAERERGGPVPLESESLLLSWFVAHAGLRFGDEAGRRLAERRARRHAQLFPDRPVGSRTTPS